jgi:hypothetical protein
VSEAAGKPSPSLFAAAHLIDTTTSSGGSTAHAVRRIQHLTFAKSSYRSHKKERKAGEGLDGEVWVRGTRAIFEQAFCCVIAAPAIEMKRVLITWTEAACGSETRCCLLLAVG